MAKPEGPVTIKKYANRRLYNTGTSTYVTLEDLATMVKNSEDFQVFDAKTGEDITRSVLTQIIVEQEGKEGQNLLPVTFLRQLIRFYGDSMQTLVPRYLEVSIDLLTKEQQKFRDHMSQAFGVTSLFGALDEQVRRNMEVFQRAFSMFTPFGRREDEGAAPSGEGGDATPRSSSTSMNCATARRHAEEGREAQRRREVISRLRGALLSGIASQGFSIEARPISSPCR